MEVRTLQKYENNPTKNRKYLKISHLQILKIKPKTRALLLEQGLVLKRIRPFLEAQLTELLDILTSTSSSTLQKIVTHFLRKEY
jgi:hypothetical protein